MTRINNQDDYPTGAVLWFGTAQPIDGWLILNGATFDKDTNPKLFDLLGSNTLPDFNGVFVKSSHTQSSIDGFTLHNDTTRNARYTAFGTNTTGNHTHRDLGNDDRRYDGHNEYGTDPTSNSDRNIMAHAGAHTHTLTGGDAETRPNNIYLGLYVKGG